MKLDGKAFADLRKRELKAKASECVSFLGRRPKLVVILVGNDPASQVYVSHKERSCASLDIESEIIRLPESITVDELKAKIRCINEDVSIDGLLVQLPLPGALQSFDPLAEISPIKDVDGLTPTNMGLMLKKKAYAEPCTPSGIIKLLKYHEYKFAGSKAVVLGRSQIVGWPMAWMLTRENATVSVCHSKTPDIKSYVRDADLVIAAAGQPHLLNVQDFKEGAFVIDVGIHRRDGKLIGDVDTEGFEAQNISYSPVPGGVGPMTVSVLMENLLSLASHSKVRES